MAIFYGSCSAIVTPFTKDGKEINFNTLKKLIDYQLDNGTNAIVFLGTTGESSTLTKEEKISIVKFAVSYINGRVPVIVGAGSNNTKIAVENSILYESLGADALLHVTPYYNKCTQNGLIKHYLEIANSVNIPIILYNVPSRTGVNILPSTVEKLSKHKNITAIKEASGNMDQITSLLSSLQDDFSVYSGDDALTLPILSVGGKGVISVISNVAPREMANLCSAYFSNDYELCKEIQLKLYPLIKLLFLEVNPIPIRAALQIAGFDMGPPRLPLTPAESETILKLKAELKKLKIIN